MTPPPCLSDGPSTSPYNQAVRLLTGIDDEASLELLNIQFIVQHTAPGGTIDLTTFVIELFNMVANLARSLHQVLLAINCLSAAGVPAPPAGATPEETRQYLLARLRRNPIGVAAEATAVIDEAGGPYTPPAAAPGTPHAVFPAMADDLRASLTDPNHPFRRAVNEIVADMRALVQGVPPTPSEIPTTPADILGAAPPLGPNAADPDANALLTPSDLTAVAQTTGSATA